LNRQDTRDETQDEFTLKQSRELVERLSESKIFRDYEKAFFESSGLPLAIRPIESFQIAMQGKAAENRFCAMMAKTSKSCVNCLEIQAEMERTAKFKTHTIQCFAGLCDTMVPIRIGEKLIAFLQTGQVLLHEPNRAGFQKVAQKLIGWGSSLDLKELEEAYFQSRVLTEKQYHGFLKLLTIFAEHLSIVGNSINIKDRVGTPPSVIRTRKFIEEHYDEQIHLDDVAKKVNTSVRYFCKVFKKFTGMTFVEYLTRLRIEKSKHLLLDSNKRVSEIAFEVGFESLTQFNRSFKKFSGQTPTEYRKTL
jgi:AraC-like DNA-binding protein/ligand-binding sensor protein